MPVWRNPAAWFGLAALAIPIAVHLLARTRAHVVRFPSLRFIAVSRLAARKRRKLTDLALLALRLAALTLAVAACADPVWLTASRRAAWGARVSRAVVLDTSASMARAGSAAAAASVAGASAAAAAPGASASVLRQTTIRSTSLREGVARAVAWLRTSPPSRREIEVVSDFQAGTVDAALLREVPADVGLRFRRVRAAGASSEATADTRPVSARRTGASSIANASSIASASANGNASVSAFEWKRTQVRVTEDAIAIASRSTIASSASVSAPTSTSTSTPASGAASAPAPIAIAESDTGFTLTPFGVRVSVSSADRRVARATMEAVLAEGVAAPAQPGRAVHVLLTADAVAPGPIATPWMADALEDIAMNRALTAVAAESVAVGAPAQAHAAAATPAPGQAAVSTAASTWRAILMDAHATPLLLAGARDGELLLWWRAQASSPATALLFRAVLTALAAPDTFADAEVRTIPDSALHLWTRPAAEPTTDALRNVEESDRRWLWAAALAVLLIEMWLRRDRQRATREQVEVHEHAA